MFSDLTTTFGSWSTVDGTGHAGSTTLGSIINIRSTADASQCVASLTSFDQDGFTINASVATVQPWCAVKCYP
jgi:hypothetical protein